MTDVTPRGVRQMNGEFRRVFWGYDTELVDKFLDAVAKRLEELIEQNVELTERADGLQEQVASFCEREKAIDAALVAAQQVEADAEARAEHEAGLVRTETQREAERIRDGGGQSTRNLTRALERLAMRKSQFVNEFRSLLEQYLVEEGDEDDDTGAWLSSILGDNGNEAPQ